MIDSNINLCISLPADRARILLSALNSGSVGIMDMRDALIAEDPNLADFYRDYYEKQKRELGHVWVQLYQALEQEDLRVLAEVDKLERGVS